MGGGSSSDKKKKATNQPSTGQTGQQAQQSQQSQVPQQQQPQQQVQQQQPPQQQQQQPLYQQQNQQMPPPPPQNNMPSYLMPLRQKVTVMNNDISLRKKTICFVDAPGGNGKKNIMFKYDALKPMELRMYIGGVENLEFFTNLTMSISGDKHNEYHNLQQCGKDLSFQSDFQFDANTLKDTGTENKENYWPVIIRIERFPEQGTQYSERKIIYYYCNMSKDGSKIKLVKQKLEFNHEAYEILEIYGIQASGLETAGDEQEAANVDDQNKDCIICFTDQIDTVIMPCRHMCICMECAKSLQQQKKKSAKQCPVCRKDIESFLRIKREENKQ